MTVQVAESKEVESRIEGLALEYGIDMKKAEGTFLSPISSLASLVEVCRLEGIGRLASFAWTRRSW